MRRTFLRAAGGAALALAAGPAAPADARPRSAAPPAATVAITEADALAQRQEERAIALLNAAERAMGRADRSCVLNLRPTTTYTHAAPSRALLDTFVLLRRPAIPQDSLLLPTGMVDGIGAEGIYVDWIRMGRAADGRESYLVAAQRAWRPPALPRACQRLRRRLLVRLTRKEPASVRRIALRVNERGTRLERKAASAPPSGEIIYSFSGGIVKGDAGGGSGTDLATFRKRGLFIIMQPTLDDFSIVTGWVPDGVASVDVAYPGQVSRGPHRPAVVYGDAVQLTVKAQDNLVSYPIDRPGGDALPPLMTWRAADGSVVRVVRSP